MASGDSSRRQLSSVYGSILGDSKKKVSFSPKGAEVKNNFKNSNVKTSPLNSSRLKSSPTIKVSDEVAIYVSKCTSSGINPVLPFVAALSEPALPVCDLSRTKVSLTEKQLMCICESLKYNRSIKELILTDNQISNIGANYLSAALKENRGIEKINLSDNKLGNEGVVYIAEALPVNNALKEIILKANEIGNEGAVALAEALQHNKTLTKLDLQGNKIKPQGAVSLSAILKINNTLQSLNLRFNEIGENGATALGMALKLNFTGLNDLDLGGNKIGPNGAIAIGEGLEENKTILKLNLRSNNVDDSGAVALANSLSINKTLKELYLGNNKIDINGSVALAESLKHNNTIKKLDLQGIRLGTAGTLAFSDAIRINSSLSHFVLELDKLTKEETSLIAEGMKQNTTLLEFNIGETDRIEEYIVYSIETTLRLNKVIAGLLETTGFNDHWLRNVGALRSVLGPSIESHSEMEISQLVAFLVDQLRKGDPNIAFDFSSSVSQLPKVNIDFSNSNSEFAFNRQSHLSLNQENVGNKEDEKMKEKEIVGVVSQLQDSQVNLEKKFKQLENRKQYEDQANIISFQNRLDLLDSSLLKIQTTIANEVTNQCDLHFKKMENLISDTVSIKLAEENQILLENISQLQKQLSDSQYSQNTLQNRIDALESTLSQIQSTIPSKDSILQNEIKLKNLETFIESISSKLNNELLEIFTKSQTKLEKVEESLLNQQNKIESLESTITDVQSTMSQVSSLFDVKVKKLELSVESISSEFSEAISRIQNKYQKMEDFREHQILNSQEIKEEIQALQDKFISQETTLSNLRSQKILPQIENVKRLESSVESIANKVNSEIIEVISQIQYRIQKTEDSLENQVQFSNQKSSEFNSLRNRIQSMEFSFSSNSEDKNNMIVSMQNRIEKIESNSNYKLLENELKRQYQQSLNTLQTNVVQELEEFSKKQEEIVFRMGIIEQALKNEQEISIKALHAIMDD